MPEGKRITDKWNTFQPTKTMLLWSCVACVALTMIIGFSWGGWTTAGTAAEMVDDAAHDAKAELAATICAEKFLGMPDVAAQLAQLKETSTWKRDDFIKNGGWVTLAGLEKPVPGAAELCADRLAAVELPVAEVQTTGDDPATIAN